jgi:predicted esterase
LKYIKLILLLFSFGYFACQSSNNSSIKVVPKNFNPDGLSSGVVLTSVLVHSNRSHSYSIYLPSKKIENNRYNILIFFDPHAEAVRTITKYKNLAEKYSCILIASNDSKNGVDVNTSKQIVEELVNESIEYYQADEKKILLCGFSGGAKVAINSAVEMSNISRVVYCGAASPFQNCNHQLSLLGFAGRMDMNYSEVVSAGLIKSSNNVNNYCVEWNGKHEWPDSATFEQAFYFIDNNYFKLNVIKIDESKVKLMEEEQIIHQKYISDLQTKDEVYWQSEIIKLNSNIDENGLNQRLLGFISLMCYSIANQIIHQGDVKTAKRILNIYKMADPKNPDCDYFFALMYAKMNQPDRVFISLNNAIANGFKDVAKVKSEPILSNFFQDKQMNEVITKIK